MHFENIDAAKPAADTAIERICVGGGRSLTALGRTPVYWVSAELIDLLHDPRRYAFLHEECLEKAFGDDEARQESRASSREEPGDLAADLERFWEGLERCSGALAPIRIPALGVYLAKLSPADLEAVAGSRLRGRELVRPLRVGEPAVFVCTSRCGDRLDDIATTSLSRGDALACSIAQVVHHELRHAWFKTDPALYATPWGRLVEESLCERASLDYFKGQEEESLINQLLELDRGIEYRCYRHWSAGAAPELETAWKSQRLGDLEEVGRYHYMSRGRRKWTSMSLVDELFGDDFGDFCAKHGATKSEKDLVKLFWMAAARTLLRTYREETR